MSSEAAASVRQRSASLALTGALAVLLVLLPSAAADAATVTKLADTDGECAPADCSLREAIESGDGVIDFVAGLAGAIALRKPLPELSHDVEIRGPGPKELTVRPGARTTARMIFKVSGEANVEISGLRVRNGSGFLSCSEWGCYNAGGGIYNGPDATLTIANATVSGNEVSSGGSKDSAEGGGIHNAGTMAILNSTVAGNKVIEGGGGGISNTGTLTLVNSTVSGNEIGGFSGSGAGIYNVGGDSWSGTLTLVNSTVSGNRIDVALTGFRYIGGVQSVGSRGELTAVGSTIANNRPINLAVRPRGSTATLRSTIIARPAARSPNCDLRDPHLGRGTLTSEGYNLADDRSCNLTRATDHPNADPRLAPLRDNGGPTPTMALLPASPAIDQGISNDLDTDQRGRPRPADFSFLPNAAGGDGSDIGAFERQSLAPFAFRKLIRNRSRGTARQRIWVASSGRLVLRRNKKVRRFARRVEDPGVVAVRVRPRGQAKRRLARAGEDGRRVAVRVHARVTFNPQGGPPRTKTRRVWLVRVARR